MEGGSCPRLLNGVRVDPELQAPVKGSFYHCQGPETLNVHYKGKLPLDSAWTFVIIRLPGGSVLWWPGSGCYFCCWMAWVLNQVTFSYWTSNFLSATWRQHHLSYGDTMNIKYQFPFLLSMQYFFPPLLSKRDANPGKVERQLGWVCPKAKGLNFCYTLDLSGSIWKSMKVFSTLQCCLPPSFWMPLGPSYLSGRKTNVSLGHNAVIRSKGFNVLPPSLGSRARGRLQRKRHVRQDAPWEEPHVLLKLARTVAKLSPTDPRRIIPKYRLSRQLWQGEVRVTG